MTGAEADAEYERRAVFVRRSVSSYRSQFTVLQKNYQVITQLYPVYFRYLCYHLPQDMVEELISQLDVHTDQSLRFLSSRLDFNEHYKSLAIKNSDKLFQKKPRKK